MITSILAKLVSGRLKESERIEVRNDDDEDEQKSTVELSYRGPNVRVTLSLTHDQWLRELLLAIPEDALRPYVNALPERK